jgi:hypothetical protein
MRKGLQVYRPIDSTENPIVGCALGCLNTGVGRNLADCNFQQIAAAKFDRFCDIILETVESTLVLWPGTFAIDPYLRVRHHTLKNDINNLVLPTVRKLKTPPVPALLISFIIVKAIIVCPEALKLPVRRHSNRCPFAAVSPACTIELPFDVIIPVLSGKIQGLSLLTEHYYGTGS